MELSTAQMKQLKAIELEILRDFIRACDAMGLRYYVLGGTLLGAVRHGGFIPWDDDIDVGMPRADYDIFAEKGQRYFPDHIFIQTHRTEKNYVNNYMKIRNSKTTFIETSTKNLSINHGVFIDVFPLDGYVKDDKRTKVFQWKNRIYIERLREELYRENIPAKSHVFAFFLKAIYPSSVDAVEKREKLFKSMPEGDYWANHCGAWGEKEIMPADWYGEGTELEFEGMKVNAPKEYEKWLSQVYGDYKKLPPVEKRVTHHDTEVIDLNASYKKYLKS